MARANELYTQAFAILSTGKRMSSRSATGEAYYMLARLYEAGLGTPKDPAKAKEWFQQAANFGSGQAKDELNKMTTRETMPLKP